MKIKLIILSICVMAGCGQGNNFDLEKIEFPTTKSSIKFNLIKGIETFDFIIYDTRDKAAMYFDNLSFSGTLNKDERMLFIVENQLSFYEDKKSKKIDAYQIEIKTTNKTLELEKLLEKRFGQADFYYKRENDFSFRIWESGNKSYFFEVNYTGEYNGKSHISSDLYVVNKNNEILYHYVIAGGFQYYADYLNEKEKEEHKNQHYSYKDFVIQKEKEAEQWGGENFYAKDYIK